MQLARKDFTSNPFVVFAYHEIVEKKDTVIGYQRQT